MSQTFLCRLFGGRDIGVQYDNGAQTLTILGQSIAISSLPVGLQAQLQAAIGAASGPPNPNGTGSRPAFGGSDLGSTIGEILDNQPNWRNAITAALAVFVSEQTLGGLAPDVQSFNR